MRNFILLLAIALPLAACGNKKKEEEVQRSRVELINSFSAYVGTYTIIGCTSTEGMGFCNYRKASLTIANIDGYDTLIFTRSDSADPFAEDPKKMALVMAGHSSVPCTVSFGYAQCRILADSKDVMVKVTNGLLPNQIRLESRSQVDGQAPSDFELDLSR